MNVLDLFSGIGGFSLGLERAEMRTIALCEIDPYCRRVLRRHWPDVPVYGDIRELTAARLVADAGTERRNGWSATAGRETWSYAGTTRCGIDVICGGFPCQDISVAGKGAGMAGARSGLWGEYARIIGEVRPRYVIVENVAALLGRGLERVLGDLAALGFDAEWHCISASAVGAPHRRDRIWIVAYPSCKRRQQIAGSPHGDEAEDEGWAAQHNHVAQCDGQGNGAWDVANAAGDRRDEGCEDCNGLRLGASGDWIGQSVGTGPAIPDADGAGRQQQWRPLPIREELTAAQCGDWWLTEPDVGRVAHGIPARVDRLRALGNAVVPQITEIIGRAIMSAALEPKP